jgi:hypothetical protein
MKDAEQQSPPYKLAIWSFSSGRQNLAGGNHIPTLRYAAQHGAHSECTTGRWTTSGGCFARRSRTDGFAVSHVQPLLRPDMPRVAVTSLSAWRLCKPRLV